MFKDKKIQEFIEKNEEAFYNHNYAELEEFLRKIDGIESIISKINKLSNQDANYALLTISKYQDFHLDEDAVGLILNHKLELIKQFKNDEYYPELDHIYYALQPNECLYKIFVQDYKENISATSRIYIGSQKTGSTLENYSYVLSKYYKEFHGMLEKSSSTVTLKKRLTALAPKYIRTLLSFQNNYSKLEYKRKIFHSFVVDEKTSNMINDLSLDRFCILIQFLFSFNEELDQNQVLASKLKLVPEILKLVQSSSNIQNKNLDMKLLLHNLSGLPEYYMIQLGEDIASIDNLKLSEIQISNFLEIFSKEEGRKIVEYISESSPNYDEEIYQLLTSREFNMLPMTYKQLIMKYLPGRKKSNVEVYQAQKEFLFNSDSYDYAFTLLELNPSYFEKTLEFIADEEDAEVLKAKFEALICIREELESNCISLEQYQKYLEILNKDLESKTKKEKKKYLKARSKYFEKNSFASFINHFESNKKDEALIKLLETENSVKKMKKYYSFAEFVDLYDSNIVSIAVERLSSMQFKKNIKMFVDFITDEYFMNSDVNRQKTLLNLFSIESETEKIGRNLEITVPDISYLESVIAENNKTLEFKNKETGMKVFVKTTTKNSKNN